ncbi:hypothetical protein V1504DRAFT_83632 [Lipomyces starkeyi]
MLHFSTSPLVLYVSLVISFAHFCNCSSVYRMPEALRTSLVPQPDDIRTQERRKTKTLHLQLLRVTLNLWKGL